VAYGDGALAQEPQARDVMQVEFDAADVDI
jgi:hypothetical protein